MLKKSLLTFSLLFTTAAYCQNLQTNSLQNDNLITNFAKLSQEQLYDTANYYLKKNNVDTALICFGLVANTPAKSNDLEQQDRIVNALNRSGGIYTNMCDYRSAYKYFIDALLLSEKYNVASIQYLIHNNLGSIYLWFKKFDMAKSYYFKALTLCEDTASLDRIFSNLGVIELENGAIDSAFHFFNKALQISKQYNSNRLSAIQNNIASLYQKINQYDSAFHYFQLSLHEARKNYQIEYETEILSGLGKLFFEVKKTDSALFYLDLSNTLAAENNFLRVLAENYLTLSEIEEAKGNIRNAFKHYKTYSNLKDSVFNTDIFGDISQLQRLFEVSKTNRQIEQLIIEQQIKERTIHYQKMIWHITLCFLFLVSIGALYIYLQKRNLSRAYKVLFEKNLEIIESQKNSSETFREKYKKRTMALNLQDELLDRILLIMEDTSIVCDTEFSIDKLAELVHSNQNYVSQVINCALKKNFRSFINSYRIQEAQRLFSEPDATKYTIESVALRVGFKSPNAFRDAFRDITGITPNFYLKAMQKNLELIR